MSGAWAPKRFWTEAGVAPAEGGWTVLLDGRQAKTPGKSPLVLPSCALAEAVAAEWQAQERELDPETMPFTKMANSAIEKVAPLRPEIAQMVAEYGGTDLLCYRAPGPEELIRRQRAWDRMLDWAEERFGARLVATEGVMHVPQDGAALERLAAEVHAVGPYELAALHDLVALTGSLVLGLAVAQDHLALDEAWALSRIDEDFQAEQWGADDEASAVAARKRRDLEQAKRFLDLVRLPD